MRSGDGGVDLGVGEDDVWAFATELERDALQRRRGVAHDNLCRFTRSGECNLIDTRMLGDCSTGGGPIAGNNVNYTVGNAGLLGQPRHAQTGERRLLGWL